jgi:putative phosphoribosyl transferase
MPFLDRVDAGRRLANPLDYLRGEDVVVLGVPRCGIPVAVEVAQALRAPLDVIVVRKLSAPYRPDMVIGAIGEGGVCALNHRMVRLARLSASDVAEIEEEARARLRRMERLYRSERPSMSLEGRTAVVVDDGVETGVTARVACEVARDRGAATVVLAVPVGPPNVVVELGNHADTVLCLETPEPFLSIGRWYADPRRTLDDEALDLLRNADPCATDPTPPHRPGSSAGERDCATAVRHGGQGRRRHHIQTGTLS